MPYRRGQSAKSRGSFMDASGAEDVVRVSAAIPVAPEAPAINSPRRLRARRDRPFPAPSWEERAVEPWVTGLFVLGFAGQAVRNLLGWVGYGVAVALAAAMMLYLAARVHRSPRTRRLPVLALAFAAVCLASTAWSAYQVDTLGAGLIMALTTAVGIAAAWACTLTTFARALTRSLQIMLASSLALEAGVAIFLRHPLDAPATVQYLPSTYHWVNGDLLRGGPIQGIFGNRNPLGFAALIAAVCFAVMYLSGRMGARAAAAWMAVAMATQLLTRSATVTVGLLACFVALCVLLVVRATRPENRAAVVHWTGFAAAAAVVAAVYLHRPLTVLLGRDSDMTGRVEIWRNVAALAEIRPLGGWGWIIYWAPWIPLYNGFLYRSDGTPIAQAHDAYLEAWLQVGLLGLAVLVAAVAWALWRGMRQAYERAPWDFLQVLPAVLIVALAVQSLTESRLLSEGNWVLFAALCTYLSASPHSRRDHADAPRRREHSVAPTTVPRLPLLLR